MPPELGPDSIAVLSGPTFMYSDSVGDVPAGSIGGLVHLDTRLLSGWLLTVNGGRLLVLRSQTLQHYSAQFVLTNPDLPGLPTDSIGLRRLRYIGDGFHERIELVSFRTEPVGIEIRLAVEADFADLFEVKSGVRDRSARIDRRRNVGGAALVFAYANGDFTAETSVLTSIPPDRVEGDDLIWQLDLAPRQRWQLDLHVPLPPGLGVVEPVRGDIAEVIHGRVDDPLRRWVDNRALVRSDNPMLERVLGRSREDLGALRLDMEIKGQQVMLPGAGLPWFLTVFGRDTLITAYQTLVAGPALARGALLALARLQGTRCDEFTDEEPGKILHEFRSGELTRTGVKPYNPNYGTADATQLWLILLSEYWRWTRDDDTVRHLRDNALAALRWIDSYGDRDGDGYVEYGTRSPEAWETSAGETHRTACASPTARSRSCRSPRATCRATRTTPRCGWRSWRTDRWTIRPSPCGYAQMPPHCSNGSTATSGSRNAAATTRWASTGTRTGSTRRPRTWVTCCGAASSRRIGPNRWCGS
ncbi:glycogen debranching N-terminal domain-containing protein [Micromonospora sp. WMMD980]|uniref:glycogen debranching N-terminal domain-containing protein n=1 Tax=Micromonospora sp. WMMD980 TaxID=3016088 RepID=UPI00241810AB|nr:glycogen debranching N-terminal domain-containing protein [Micromonospora sp. WMMD980]MDG4800080.1 glycogen debranching N-terminal domain-containing protein [Micromonospora sp. WMMD980]